MWVKRTREEKCWILVLAAPMKTKVAGNFEGKQWLFALVWLWCGLFDLEESEKMMIHGIFGVSLDFFGLIM